MRISNVNERTKYSFQRRAEINYGVVTQAARQLKDIGILKLTPAVYSRFLTVLATRSEAVATKLANLGFQKTVTPRALVKKYGDVFTPKGLMDGCIRDISNSCIDIGLDPREIKFFSFLKEKGVKKHPILSILHSEDSLPVVKKAEPELKNSVHPNVNAAKPKNSLQRFNESNYGAIAQTARQLRDISILKLNPIVYSRFLNVLAARSKVVADNLAALGLPKEVTPKILVKKYRDVFTRNGLTDECVRNISNACIDIGLDPREIKVFSFLRQKDVSRHPILDILQSTNSSDKPAKKIQVPEAPSAAYLRFKAKIAAEAEKAKEDIIKFFAAKEKTVVL